MFAYMFSNSDKLEYYGAASLMFKLLDDQFLQHLLWGIVNVEGVAWDISLISTREFGVGAGLSEVADEVIINYFYNDSFKEIVFWRHYLKWYYWFLIWIYYIIIYILNLFK